MRRKRWLGLAACAAVVLTACGSAAAGTGGNAASRPARRHPVVDTGEAGFRALHGKVRVHYIAADPVAWDYAPSGKNLITGLPLGPNEATWTQQGADRIGHVYEKSLYREYTDATFTHLLPRPPEWQHLGDLGPVLHAEVGDTLEIVFKNNTPFPAGMHPHGVFYQKDSEGAPYDDGTGGKDKADDAVPQGGSHTYVWEARERSGPGPQDGSSVMWMYHGHTDEVADTYSGLMGPMIVTRKGFAKADGSPRDVDREFVVNFMVDDQNKSYWLDDNIARHTGNPASVDTDDEDFQESNLMHSMNGYVFGNLPGLTMRVGERVRWYVMGMGTEVDLHTPHWHGNTVVSMGMRTDVLQLLPAGMLVADMRPDNAGTWLFHCHVADHITAGMQATYTVLPRTG